MSIGLQSWLRQWLLPIALVTFNYSCSESVDMISYCAQHADCPAGYACNFTIGVCEVQPKCQKDSDCCPGVECFKGGCLYIDHCQFDSDCLGDDQTCYRGQCVAEKCTAENECTGLNTACMGGYCVNQKVCGQCPTGTLCEPLTARCVLEPQHCTGLICAENEVRTIKNGMDLWGLGCDWSGAVCECAVLSTEPSPLPGPWLNLVSVDGRLAIVGREPARGQVVFQTVNGQELSSPVILDPELENGSYISAASLDGGIVAVARDGSSDRLRYVAEQGSHTIDERSGAGYGADLHVDENDNLHATYFVLGDDAVASLYYAYTTQSKPASAQDWSRISVHSGPLASLVELPCDGECELPFVCVEIDGASVCDIADILGRCEPKCSRSEVCVSGECRPIIRRNVGLRPWDDTPGGDSAVTVRTGEVLVAYHDHREGTVRWATGPVGGPLSSTAIAGGFGNDVGHHIEVAASGDGPIVVAYQDAHRQRINMLHGMSSNTLVPVFDQPGGKGIALDVMEDGTVVLAHGAVDGTAVRVNWGTPGNWVSYSPSYAHHVGRFNGLVVDVGSAYVSTLVDRIDSQLKPISSVEFITVSIDELE